MAKGFTGNVDLADWFHSTDDPFEIPDSGRPQDSQGAASATDEALTDYGGYKMTRDGLIVGRVLFTNKQHGIELVKRLKDFGGILEGEVRFWAYVLSLLDRPDYDVITCPPQRKPRPFHLATALAKHIAEIYGIPFRQLISSSERSGHAKYTPEKLQWQSDYEATEDVKGLRVLVVDDVISTRRTAGACARCLDGAFIRFLFMYSAHG